jgi:integrase
VSKLGPEDFSRLLTNIETTCKSPTTVINEINRITALFKYGVKAKEISEQPFYGLEFCKPQMREVRLHKAKQGKKLFTRKELLAILDEASVPLKATTLLGINCGFGNTDVSDLTFDNLDLRDDDVSWVDYARNKTGIGRRCPLWRETVEALRAAIAERPQPKLRKEDKEIVLLNSRRERFVRVSETGTRTDGITTGFRKILKKLDVNGRKGLGFYSLRHTFATIGLQTGDRDAVKALMGHAQRDTLATYDETGPSDERLKAVTDHVHAWLFDEEEGGAV